MNTIRIIPSHEIDSERWNACLLASENRMIYAEKIFLDHMADHWDGLVLNDYEAIFPLPWRKKWGVHYGYQPPFIQQLGVFAPSATLSPSLINAFLQTAQKHLQFAEITFNHAQANWQSSSIHSLRTNYLLSFGNNKQLAYSSNDIKDKLQRSANWNLVYAPIDSPKEIIDTYQSLYQEKQQLQPLDYLRFNQLMQLYAEKKRLVMRKVSLPDAHNWLAAVLMVEDGKRLYNLASCLLPEGRKKLANYVLFDALIREMNSSEMILDFEGSDIPGIAHFYEQFTSQKESYPFVRWNLLPSWLRWLKK
jgi:hypothetical protein